MVTKWLFLNIPEYDGSAHRDDDPGDYFVKGMDKSVVTFDELMAILIAKYGE
ncbi:MAG: hypothetical protein IJI46_02290 [Erysipelotrichaceae bacterium]|nr:hypothetical protein [Erysipelotrichaceae bacterium]